MQLLFFYPFCTFIDAYRHSHTRTSFGDVARTEKCSGDAVSRDLCARPDNLSLPIHSVVLVLLVDFATVSSIIERNSFRLFHLLQFDSALFLVFPHFADYYVRETDL